MADSTTHLDTIVQGSGSQDIQANALYDAMSQAALYGRRAASTTGLTWGFYGGNVTKSDGTQATVGNNTCSLTASNTNYITAQKADGVVYCSTSATNWNDTANFWRLYIVVAGASTITSYTDEREFGKMTGAGGSGAASSVAPVTKTTAFTLGANENEVIINGTASITVTLPAASAFVGRVVRFKTRAAFTLISASSNVKPIGTDTAGTAILPALAGWWAVIVSDGTNWVVMAQGSDAAEFGAPPAIKVASFTVNDGESVFICNGTASITATLPAAATYPGRRIRLKTIAAYAVVSASSNVKPINTDTAGTALLKGIAGSWAVIVSDGTNWVVTEQGTDDSEFGTPPVIKTTAFTVADGESVFIVNGTASVTATLPAAATYPGRRIRFKTIAAYPVVSASSNVKPINTDTAGTAILRGIAGSWAVVVSDGTNWVVTERGGDDTQFLAPVTKTGDFTVADGENSIVCNGTATVTITFPAAATFPGRVIKVKTIAAFTVVSASSNVKPLDTNTAGTAILAATAGKWAEIVSDGTDWVIMQGN